jgi:hypothetical protein
MNSRSVWFAPVDGEQLQVYRDLQAEQDFVFLPNSRPSTRVDERESSILAMNVDV